MLISQEKKIKNRLSLLLLIISLPFLLSAMEEKPSLQKQVSFAKKTKLTKGQRRKIQRKRAKARPANQTASEEFFEYFYSYLTATDNPNLPATSLSFFRTYVLFWTPRYHELGILDKVLDTYFETTETTPNTIIIDSFSEKKTSFLQHIAQLSAHGNINAKILFKKLLDHGGDHTLKINGYPTDCLIQEQDWKLRNGLITFDNDKEKDQTHRKRALRNTKEMLNYLIKKETEDIIRKLIS